MTIKNSVYGFVMTSIQFLPLERAHRTLFEIFLSEAIFFLDRKCKTNRKIISHIFCVDKFNIHSNWRS